MLRNFTNVGFNTIEFVILLIWSIVRGLLKFHLILVCIQEP